MDDWQETPGSKTEDSAARAGFDEAVRVALGTGDVARAAQEALRRYGPELFGFLVAVVGDREAAGTVYANACRHMETELAALPRTCSLQTGMYAIVRRRLAAHRQTGPHRTTGTATDFELTDPSRTVSRRPANRRAAIAALRMHLPPEDRELLVLRIDRSLDWTEVAITSLGWDASKLDLAREARRLRARMRAVREELARAVRDGEPTR